MLDNRLLSKTKKITKKRLLICLRKNAWGVDDQNYNSNTL